MDTSYNILSALLTSRCKDSRKLANNTYLVRRGENIAVRLHDTDVATYLPNGDVILNSEGWRTPTTKARINDYLPGRWRLIQEGGVWYLVNPPPDSYAWGKEQTRYRFADGVTIQENEIIVGALPDNRKQDRAIKRKIKAYAQLCADAVPIPQPSSADCWFCCMVTQGGKTLADATKDINHLSDHMAEGYIVPSLVYYALKERYNAPAAFWEAFEDTGWTGNRDFGRHVVKRAVYRYIARRFGYAV